MEVDVLATQLPSVYSNLRNCLRAANFRFCKHCLNHSVQIILLDSNFHWSTHTIGSTLYSELFHVALNNRIWISCSISLDFDWSRASWNFILNRKGPRTEPCGTPTIFLSPLILEILLCLEYLSWFASLKGYMSITIVMVSISTNLFHYFVSSKFYRYFRNFLHQLPYQNISPCLVL